MRITIGHKIFAVACLLLVLMLSSALLSTWKLRQASREANAVAHYFMPLANRIANTRAHLLQQDIVVQRILHDFDVPNVRGETIDAHLAEFRDLGAKADAEIAKAVALADMALAATTEEFGRREMAQVAALINSMEQQHKDIQDLVERSVDAHRGGRNRGPRVADRAVRACPGRV